MKNIVFPLNKFLNLKFALPVPLNELQFTHVVTATLNKEDFSSIVIFKQGTAFNCFSSLENSLQDVLHNELKLSGNSDTSLGIWDNTYQHLLIKKSLGDLDTFELEEKTEPYDLWEGNNNKTWLYNQNDKIYLEVTPTYPWHFDNPLSEENFISFEDFMEHYTIILKEEVLIDYAQQWLEETKRILGILYKNTLGQDR